MSVWHEQHKTDHPRTQGQISLYLYMSGLTREFSWWFVSFPLSTFDIYNLVVRTECFRMRAELITDSCDVLHISFAINRSTGAYIWRPVITSTAHIQIITYNISHLHTAALTGHSTNNPSNLTYLNHVEKINTSDQQQRRKQQAGAYILENLTA